MGAGAELNKATWRCLSERKEWLSLHCVIRSRSCSEASAADKHVLEEEFALLMGQKETTVRSQVELWGRLCGVFLMSHGKELGIYSGCNRCV